MWPFLVSEIESRAMVSSMVVTVEPDSCFSYFEKPFKEAFRDLQIPPPTTVCVRVPPPNHPARAQNLSFSHRRLDPSELCSLGRQSQVPPGPVLSLQHNAIELVLRRQVNASHGSRKRIFSLVHRPTGP